MTDAFLTLDEAAALIPGADANTLKRMHRAGKRVAETLDECSIKMILEDRAWTYFSTWVSHARARAKKRNLAFELVPKFLTSLAVAQNFKCAVSGIDLEFKSAIMREYRRYPFAASVDRVDCKDGYTPGNVRIVCLIVNLARSDFGDEALFKMCDAVAERGK